MIFLSFGEKKKRQKLQESFENCILNWKIKIQSMFDGIGESL